LKEKETHFVAEVAGDEDADVNEDALAAAAAAPVFFFF